MHGTSLLFGRTNSTLFINSKVRIADQPLINQLLSLQVGITDFIQQQKKYFDNWFYKEQ